MYTRGFISYPRTETDQFDKAIDLKKLVEKQIPDNNWGEYARRHDTPCHAICFYTNFSTSLLDGKFKTPRSGRHNDQAHPPIHPICWVSPNQLKADERRVYEFVVRRFLACCSDDAKGNKTEIELQYGEEIFRATGLVVLEKNYLDVYVYEKWESSTPLPAFQLGEIFEPTEAKIVEGKTTAPNYLTEPELIALMDANGIGTDATMAEHIAKIKDREYVATRPRGGREGGGRAVQEFIPTRLGIALIEGYDNIVAGLPDCPSLGKPFLRKEMEQRMREICAGTKTRGQVVQESLEMYHEVFVQTQRRIEVLKDACRRYVIQGEA